MEHSVYTLHAFSLQDVAVFLQEFKAPDILLGVIAKSRSPRLTVRHFTTVTSLHAARMLNYMLYFPCCLLMTSYNYPESLLQEICVGILGNMACFHDTCVFLSQNSDLGWDVHTHTHTEHIFPFCFSSG